MPNDETRQLLSLVLQTTNTAFWEYHFRGQRFIWPREHYELYGIDADTAPSIEHWLKAVHPDDRPQFSRQLKEWLEGQSKEMSAEFRVNHKFRGTRWFAVRGQLFCGEDGEQRIVGITQDVTRIKGAEEVIRRDARSLERMVAKKTEEFRRECALREKARRLEEGHSLAEAMANELRNPLAALRLALFNLKKKLYTPFSFDQFEHIDHKLEESAKAIENMIAYFNIGMPDPAAVEIAAVIAESIDESARKNRAGNKAKLDLRLEPLCGIQVEADAAQLKQMFMHILDNAFEACDKRKSTVEVKGNVMVGGVFVTVTDNGCGISREELKKVFTPLFTTKSRGAGLGLAISRQIASLHNGTIEIESQKGRGTTVTIFLPSYTA
ncbi:MAG: ATP-binding protein [Deltaproteobacteria bacterium]